MAQNLRRTRPWRNFRQELAYKSAPKAPIVPLRKWRIVKGDMVEILSGRDRGKQGKVLRVDRKTNRLYVEGLNMTNKTVKPQGEEPGGIFKVEAPIHYSNVNLVDPVTKKATRISMRYLEDGSKVRVSKKSGTVIPKPLEATERSHPRPSKPGPSDTHPDDATSETWDGLEAEYARAVNRLRARAEANAIAQRAEPFTGTIPDAARVRAPFGQPRFRLPRPEELERMSPEDQDAAVARYREQLAARRTPRKGWWADQYLAEQRGEAGGEGEGAGGRGEASAPER